MLSIDAVHWIVQGLEISYLPFHIHEGMLMFHSVNRACKVFDVIQVLLDLIELMTPVDIQNRVIKILKICNFSLNVHERMLVLNSVDGARKVFDVIKVLLDLIELMSVVHIFSHREVHLLQSVKALQDLTILVLTVYMKNRIIESF